MDDCLSIDDDESFKPVTPDMVINGLLSEGDILLKLIADFREK